MAVFFLAALVFFFKQTPAYDLRISDWSSDVCSSDLSDAVVAEVEGREGIGQVASNLSASLPYIAVTVDRDAAAELGLSEVAVGGLVSGTMQPRSIGTVEIDGTSLTVYLARSDENTYELE